MLQHLQINCCCIFLRKPFFIRRNQLLKQNIRSFFSVFVAIRLRFDFIFFFFRYILQFFFAFAMTQYFLRWQESTSVCFPIFFLKIKPLSFLSNQYLMINLMHESKNKKVHISLVCHRTTHFMDLE